MYSCPRCNCLVSDEKKETHLEKHRVSDEIILKRNEIFTDAIDTINFVKLNMLDMNFKDIDGINLSTIASCIYNNISGLGDISSGTIRRTRITSIQDIISNVSHIDARVAYGKIYFSISFHVNCSYWYVEQTFGEDNDLIRITKKLTIKFSKGYDVDDYPDLHRLWFKRKIKTKLLSNSSRSGRNIFRIYESEKK